MKARPMPTTLTIAVAVLIAIVTVAVAGWGLTAIARPADYQTRVAALETRLATLERVAPVARASIYSAASLCEGPLVTAANDMRGDLIRRAGVAGMTIKQLAIAPGGSAPPQRALSPIDISFMAEGSYDSARVLIGGLQSARPEVFIDAVELKPVGEIVRLKVSGRAFCWTSARP
jgi:hypothetical protein